MPFLSSKNSGKMESKNMAYALDETIKAMESLSLMGYLLSITDTMLHNKSDQNRFWSLCIIFHEKICLTFWGQFKIGQQFFIPGKGRFLEKNEFDMLSKMRDENVRNTAVFQV